MNKKVLKTLEYDKIISRLSSMADSDAAKKRIARLTPSSNRNKIISLQAETTAALCRILKDKKPSFTGLKDPRPSLVPLKKGASLNTIELLDICRIFELAKAASDSDTALDGYEDVLSGSFRALVYADDLVREIKRCIISQDEIADDASPGLKSIRHLIRGMDARIKEQLGKTIASSSSMLRDSLVTMRDGRYCLPVKSEYKSSFPGMIHDQSSTGSTFFIEPMAVVTLNNELASLMGKEKEEIEKILYDLSLLTEPHADDIEKDFLLLSGLDLIFARGALSREMRASEPLFQGKFISLKKARHPLIDPKKAVPIDVSLGKDYDLLIITGPNTGGKTVTLKTIGLLTLMGQTGLHIPAAERSHLRVYDEVFADIGDEQSIEQSLSTFSSHMVNIVDILDKANYKSLALFDELGAGTDPIEGAALAISILDHMKKKGINAAATTHYSELKLYALSEKNAMNASCEFDVETLSPTYRLLMGIPGKSNAFAIAGKLGLPTSIIEDADRRIGDEQKGFEDVVSDLEDARAKAEKERDKAVRFRENAEAHVRKLEDKEEKIERSKDKILRRANEEAREILENAKRIADESIRKYNKWMNAPEALRAMEAERGALRDALDKVDDGLMESSSLGHKKQKGKTLKSPDELAIGDIVMVNSMGVQAKVITAPTRGKCYVQIGILRSEVDTDDLTYLETETKQSIREANIVKNRALTAAKAMTIHTEINLIGKTVAEALPELEKYLDDASLAGLKQVRIIHGMGTGALRSAVHDELRRNKSIEQYRLGEPSEGGYGATIAVFKS
ncbi:MAG: endonuclease MutS2 [Eubacterium sp.]|nr:endonuclease MutS2 [Eubacterium sp.]